MTAEEARDLLPLYVAGTLAPDQRRDVESMLSADATLRADLHFWRSVSQITRSRENRGPGGHVDSQTLVQYADGDSAIDQYTRDGILSHLHDCPDCRNDLELLQRSMSKHTSVSGWRFAAAAVIVLAALGTLLTIRSSLDFTQPDIRVVIAKVPFVEYYRSSIPDTASLVRVDIFAQTDSVTLQVEIPLPHTKTMPLRWSIRGPGAGWTEYQGAFQGRATTDGYYVEWQEFGESMFPKSGRYSLKAESSQDGVFYYDIEVVRH